MNLRERNPANSSNRRILEIYRRSKSCASSIARSIYRLSDPEKDLERGTSDSNQYSKLLTPDTIIDLERVLPSIRRKILWKDERATEKFGYVIFRISHLPYNSSSKATSRALVDTPGIQGLNINILLARLELKLDLDQFPISSCKHTISYLEHELRSRTGYLFERDVQSRKRAMKTENRANPYPKLLRSSLEKKVSAFNICSVREGDLNKTASISQSTITRASAYAELIPSCPFSVPRKPHLPPYTSSCHKPSTMYMTKAQTSGVFQFSRPSRMKVPMPKSLAAGRVYSRAAEHQTLSVAAGLDADGSEDFIGSDDVSSTLTIPNVAGSTAKSSQIRKTFFIWLFAVTLTIPVVILTKSQFNQRPVLFIFVVAVLSGSVQIIAYVAFLSISLRSLMCSRIFEMDLLTTVSSTILYCFSLTVGLAQLTGRYLHVAPPFDLCTLLTTLTLLGRLVGECVRLDLIELVSFDSLQPTTALEVYNKCDDEKVKSLDLRCGHDILIPPKAIVPIDGSVHRGGSEIDEHKIRGDRKLQAKSVGSRVFAGSRNGPGELLVKTTTKLYDTMLQRIAAILKHTKFEDDSEVQEMTERIAGYLVPSLGILGVAVFCSWLFIDHYCNKHNWSIATSTAFIRATATIFACNPSAFRLAVSMITLMTLGVAARFSVVFCSPQKLHTVHEVTDVVFDQTTTLTEDNPIIIAGFYHGFVINQRDMMLNLLIEAQHPLLSAILLYLGHPSRELHRFQDVKFNNIIEVDKGIQGVCACTKQTVRIGSPGWLSLRLEPTPYKFHNTIPLCVTIDGKHVATFQAQYTPRLQAEYVLDKLRAGGFRIHMISHHRQAILNVIAHALSISKQNTKADCRWPRDALEYIKHLKRQKKVVMFVGDDHNNSDALREADIGVHFGDEYNFDARNTQADVVLMSTYGPSGTKEANLKDVLILLDISRAAYRRMLFNMGWLTVYHLLIIVWMAGVFSPFLSRGTMMATTRLAGLGELVCVVSVALVALSMRWIDWRKNYR